jgi:molybdenum cofactor biosynthesis enzyme MoaA
MNRILRASYPVNPVYPVKKDTMKPYDFANILFSGHCNLQCPHCIGHNQTLRGMPENLSQFPLNGLDRFISALCRYEITQISLTGTNTDPQLYAYEPELIAYLRKRIPGVQISLHTNGVLALRKMVVFNRYDRATISLPSFAPTTYRQMTGRTDVLDLAAIMNAANIPVKISTLLTEQNIPEISSIIMRCRELGISRMVLRTLYGETRAWNIFPSLQPVRYFAGNPVYEVDGLEVTVWDFAASQIRCLNLFSDGSISEEYQISRKDAKTLSF